jgi:hypothetical protein
VKDDHDHYANTRPAIALRSTTPSRDGFISLSAFRAGESPLVVRCAREFLTQDER